MAQRFMTVFIKNFTKNNPLSPNINCVLSQFSHFSYTFDGAQKFSRWHIVQHILHYRCSSVCLHQNLLGRQKKRGGNRRMALLGRPMGFRILRGHTSSGLLLPAAVHGLQWADGAERRCLACGRGRWPFFSGQLRTAAAADG